MRKTAVLVTMVAFSSACTLPAVIYKPNLAMPDPPNHQLRVAVAPFEDLSPTGIDTNALFNRLCVIPFPNYGSGDAYSPPWYPTGPGKIEDMEKVVGEGFPPVSPQLPSQVTRYEKCLREDLQASGLFTNVEFKDWPDLAESYSDYDLIITGRYFYDQQHWKLFSIFYAFGMGTQVLLGMPVGSIDRNLAFEIQALDPANPAEPLWAQTFKVHDDSSGLLSPYYGPEPDPRAETPKLWNKAFLEVREGLVKALGPDGPLRQKLVSKLR